jgi:hypothetical protein
LAADAKVGLTYDERPKAATVVQFPMSRKTAKNGGTISKISLGIQWDVTQKWDTTSY